MFFFKVRFTKQDSKTFSKHSKTKGHQHSPTCYALKFETKGLEYYGGECDCVNVPPLKVFHLDGVGVLFRLVFHWDSGNSLQLSYL